MFIVCTFLPKQIPCQCKLSWRINPILMEMVCLWQWFVSGRVRLNCVWGAGKAMWSEYGTAGLEAVIEQQFSILVFGTPYPICFKGVGGQSFLIAAAAYLWHTHTQQRYGLTWLMVCRWGSALYDWKQQVNDRWVVAGGCAGLVR